MISQSTLDGLKSIGLNLYERKLYASLIARGTATVGELSEMASVPRSRAYDVLESLQEKGFVVIQHSKPLKYVAVAPEEALDKAKEHLGKIFKTGVERIDKFKGSEFLTELNTLYDKGVSLVNPSDLSGAFKGSYAMDLHLGSMFKGAENSIDIMTSENGLKSLHDNHSKLLQSAKDNGVKIRIAAPLTDNNSEAAEGLKGLAELKHSGDDTLPLGRMSIVDGKQVMLGLTNDGETHASQEVSFWTASDHFAEKFAGQTFNMVWDKL